MKRMKLAIRGVQQSYNSDHLVQLDNGKTAHPFESAIDIRTTSTNCCRQLHRMSVFFKTYQLRGLHCKTFQDSISTTTKIVRPQNKFPPCCQLRPKVFYFRLHLLDHTVVQRIDVVIIYWLELNFGMNAKYRLMVDYQLETSFQLKLKHPLQAYYQLTNRRTDRYRLITYSFLGPSIFS